MMLDNQDTIYKYFLVRWWLQYRTRFIYPQRNIYTTVFQVKRLKNRTQNSENRGINDLSHEAIQYHI